MLEEEVSASVQKMIIAKITNDATLDRLSELAEDYKDIVEGIEVS